MNGIQKRRSCTDIICLFLFGTFIIGWIVVVIIAYTYGDLRRLIFPTDSEGNICGYGALKNKKNLFFFYISQCVLSGISLSNCPTTKICIESCPTTSFYAGPPYKFSISSDQLLCRYNTFNFSKILSSKEIEQLVESEQCAQTYLPSRSVAGRCIPFPATHKKDEIADSLPNIPDFLQDINEPNILNSNLQTDSKYLPIISNLQDLMSKIFSDLQKTWKHILIGLTFAAILSLLWIGLMRWIAGVVVWLSISLVLISMTIGVYFCFWNYFNLTASSKRFSILWIIGGSTLAVVTIILLLMCIFLRKRIQIAVSLIRQSSKAVMDVSTVFVFPICPILMQFFIFFFFILSSMLLASAGESVYIVQGLDDSKDCSSKCTSKYMDGNTCKPSEFHSVCQFCASGIPRCHFSHYYSNIYFGLQFYNLFGLSWGLAFVDALGQLILAGAFSCWYWTFHKPLDIPRFPLGSSMKRAITYHLGTVAFGSLIVGLFSFIGSVINYFNNKIKKYKDVKIVKVILCMCCCFRCCINCIEKFFRYINKNAYIICAVHGKNFCSSAKYASELLTRNILRVIVVNKVTDFVFFFITICILITVGVPAYYLFAYKVQPFIPLNLSNYLVPLICILTGTFFIIQCFLYVYHMAVDTLFICFLIDLDTNDGSSDKPYYMSKELMNILGKKNKKNRR